VTLDELYNLVPEQARPWVGDYGPALLAMGVDEFQAWCKRLASDPMGAYRDLLARSDADDILAAWGTLNQQWSEQDTQNAANMAIQAKSFWAALSIAAQIALAAL
jgi:hypothetical protein